MEISYLFLFTFILLLTHNSFANTVVNHNIKAELFPAQNKIVVTDTLSNFQALKQENGTQHNLLFSLHRTNNLSISPSTIHVAKQERNGETGRVAVDEYQLTLPTDIDKITLSYELIINYPVQQESEEYDRSVSDTPGNISETGVFLANESFWFPVFDDELMTFTLSLTLPGDWKSVSQGERIKQHLENNKRFEVWQESKPQDDIYLVAAKFIEYQQAVGRIKAMAFLRSKDDSLAQKYLDTTAQYLEMYQKLLGPYPYGKFALVENFWESGWGMPSFTLLGSQIIRFPFILHSSYPHELLHNWWGNSVYMDWTQGNWAEGLTTYLADHLVSEQRDAGNNYRRGTLQKYTDFTQSGKDFALKDFVTRTDSVTQAVGYGKTMMFFHMLRTNLGDELFAKALAQFYREYQFREASFSDIQHVFSAVAKRDLSPFFEQWIARVGAPAIELSSATVVQNKNDHYQLKLSLLQTQPGEAYQLQVPLVISLRGENNAQTTWVELKKKQQDVFLIYSHEPVRVDIDPGFDIFRRLDLNEIPPALSQMFGAGSSLIILPNNSSNDMKQAYQTLANNWQSSRQSNIEVMWDNELASMPKDKAVWVIGWENRYRAQVIDALATYDLTTEKNTVSLKQENFDAQTSSIVLVGRNPTNPQHGLALVTANLPQAVSGLERKLPHYSRYSYLSFIGEEPTNQVKGQWPVVGSPLSKIFQPAAEMAALEKRNALATLSPLFSKERMLTHISQLASEKMQGRGVLTDGIEKAADYIIKEYANIGLKPFKGNSYVQSWDQELKKVKKTVALKNIIGVLPGTNPKYQGETVIVSAHYDHLGLGELISRKENKGKIHFGADDNASGVAVMLEVARLFAIQKQNERTIMFIAFTAEELELLGSSYFVNNTPEIDLNKIMGVVTLDTVGRLGNNPLTVFGVGSATEWVHIFRGTGFVTGVNVKSVNSEIGFSDQQSFIAKKVPAVQFFAGANLDFHQLSDVASKIDGDGLLKVAAVLKETVVYLAEREQHLTNLLSGEQVQSRPPQTSTGGRRVSLGTVPDFAFDGEGVLVSELVPGSPAEKAGIKAKDVIVAIDNKAVHGLSDFSEVLKTKMPGDIIQILILRSEDKITVKAQLVER